MIRRTKPGRIAVRNEINKNLFISHKAVVSVSPLAGWQARLPQLVFHLLAAHIHCPLSAAIATASHGMALIVIVIDIILHLADPLIQTNVHQSTKCIPITRDECAEGSTISSAKATIAISLGTHLAE